MAKRLKPVHPGEILREEFMKPLGLSMNKLALDFARAGHPYRGDCPRAPRHLDRYGPAPGALFQHHAGFLDEPPGSL